jgi:hypothetical protein
VPIFKTYHECTKLTQALIPHGMPNNYDRISCFSLVLPGKFRHSALGHRRFLSHTFPVKRRIIRRYVGFLSRRTWTSYYPFGIYALPWMWVPVTTAWRVLRLGMEERPPIWRVAVNKLNKKPRTADEGWSSSLGVGRDANNPSP